MGDLRWLMNLFLKIHHSSFLEVLTCLEFLFPEHALSRLLLSIPLSPLFDDERIKKEEYVEERWMVFVLEREAELYLLPIQQQSNHYGCITTWYPRHILLMT